MKQKHFSIFVDFEVEVVEQEAGRQHDRLQLDSHFMRVVDVESGKNKITRLLRIQVMKFNLSTTQATFSPWGQIKLSLEPRSNRGDPRATGTYAIRNLKIYLLRPVTDGNQTKVLQILIQTSNKYFVPKTAMLHDIAGRNYVNRTRLRGGKARSLIRPGAALDTIGQLDIMPAFCNTRDQACLIFCNDTNLTNQRDC